MIILLLCTISLSMSLEVMRIFSNNNIIIIDYYDTGTNVTNRSCFGNHACRSRFPGADNRDVPAGGIRTDGAAKN